MNTDLQRKVPYAVSPPRYSVSHQMVTTTFEISNYRVVQNLGVVRGIVVRSRNIFATIGASLQTIVGGNITVWTNLCEQTRADAFEIMIQHASEIGANAVVGTRYDTTELSTGVTEVLAYGTAVIVEPINPEASYRS
ncbi:MAG TPA: YbjQ family protein [Pyrinomonadaceae bacterium]|nr:YbjQ family protein [Pyrinomonadaceae bacterium]